MTDANIAYAAALAEEALPVGTVLSGDQFTIKDHLGAGGFGITYRATDNVLGRTVVIKECFPDEFCVRDGKMVFARNSTFAKQIRSIVKMFLREAQSLAKLRHPNIVGVHRIFEENGTAYMVLDLIEGQDLFDILDQKRTALSPGRVKDILLQLLDAIEKVHNMGLLHRDISPDNILIEKDGTPVLIDFGAARGDASRHTRAVSAFLVVKEGYSPQEFYVAGSHQGPFSDLYALAATFYHVLSGRAPPSPQTRMMEISGQRPDPCLPLAGRIEGYDQAFLQAIDTAMQIHPADRLQSAAKWRSLIVEADVQRGAHPRTGKRGTGKEISLDLEMSLSRLVEETNHEVRKTSRVLAEPEVVEAPKPEKAPRPEWVEEFNQDVVTPDSEPDDFFDDDDFWDDPSTHNAEEAEPADDEVTFAGSRSAKRTENWIDRAFEKQERIRSERGTDGVAISRVQSSVPDPVELNEDLADMPATSERPRGSNIRSFGFYVGLILCGYFIFLIASP